jgi:hypothetical protein
MKKSCIQKLAAICLCLSFLSAPGCSSVVKGVVIDQIVGVATALTSAVTTSLIDSLFGGTSE